MKIISPGENFTFPCTVDACKEVAGYESEE
jgi:hypothetical protein